MINSMRTMILPVLFTATSSVPRTCLSHKQELNKHTETKIGLLIFITPEHIKNQNKFANEIQTKWDDGFS